MQSFDVVVLGAGLAGEGDLGGPSAAPLLDDHVAFRRALERRDDLAEGRDDSGAADGVEAAGDVLMRGRGRVLRELAEGLAR